MAFEAEISAAFGQELGVDRAVWIVATDTTVACRLMLEDERSALGGVAADAGVVFREELGAAAVLRGAFVRGVAIGARHPAFGHWMVVGQVELTSDVGMALKADGLNGPCRGNGGSSVKADGIGASGGKTEGRFCVAAGVGMHAARSVA